MERGRIYGNFTAHYGETVEVRGSSAVVPQCWLEINSAKDKNDYMAGERVKANALLTLPQALVLRAALDAFIDCASAED